MEGQGVADLGGPEQFIVLNAVPTLDFEQIRREFTNSPGAKVQVGVAAIFSYLGQPRARTVAELREFLRRSPETGLPIVVQLDGESWWGGRQDLWNWWDAASPGYSAGNRDNVEWTGWLPDDAIKIAWRNWGRQFRALPLPLYLQLERHPEQPRNPRRHPRRRGRAQPVKMSTICELAQPDQCQPIQDSPGGTTIGAAGRAFPFSGSKCG